MSKKLLDPDHIMAEMRRQWNLRFHHMHPTPAMHTYFEAMQKFLREETEDEPYTPSPASIVIMQIRMELLAGMIAAAMVHANEGNIDYANNIPRHSVALADAIMDAVDEALAEDEDEAANEPG